MAIQDYVLLRDHPAIEQALSARVARFQLQGLRFVSPRIELVSAVPPVVRAYPTGLAA